MPDIRHMLKGGLAQPRIHTLGARQPYITIPQRLHINLTISANLGQYIFEQIKHMLCAVLSAGKICRKNLAKILNISARAGP